MECRSEQPSSKVARIDNLPPGETCPTAAGQVEELIRPLPLAERFESLFDAESRTGRETGRRSVAERDRP